MRARSAGSPPAPVGQAVNATIVTGERHAPFLVFGVAQDTKTGSPSVGSRSVPSARTRIGGSRPELAKRSVSPPDQRVEEADEAGRLVDLQQRRFGWPGGPGVREFGFRAEAGLRAGHEDGSRHALARHITHGKPVRPSASCT
jgi:hypothetical protein